MKNAPVIALVVCYAMLLATHFYYPKWQLSGTEATLSYDVSGYYLYLPAAFIYHDLRKLEFLPEVIARYRPTESPYQAFDHPSGARVMKYSLGQAVMYAPFFALAHAYTGLNPDYPPDGFSLPYQVAISVGSLLFAALGLWLTLLVLRRYFSPGVCAASLLLLVFGTNYLNYSAIDGAMTHNHVYTLYALLLWLTDNLYRRAERAGTATFAAIGAVIGLMALTRPTEILAAILPLLWALPLRRAAWSRRIDFFRLRWRSIFLAGVATVTVGSLQLLYWHYVTGEWIVYSYQDQGFDWLHPHLADGLFSYKAGWLTYTPLMWFALLGFYPLFRRHPDLLTAAGIHTILFIYVAFAWSIWWYGGSLGQRTMVQAYAVLVFPLAATLQAVSGSRKWLRAAFAAICLLFVAHNLWFTHQAHRGGLFVTEWMNRAYYWRTLFTFERNVDDQFLLDNPDAYSGDASQADTLYRNGFEDAKTAECGLTPLVGNGSYCLLNEREFLPEFKVSGAFTAGEYLRATARFATSSPRWAIHSSTQFVIKFYRGGAEVKNRVIRVHRALNTTPDRYFTLDAKVPRGGADEVGVMVWNAGSNQSAVLVDDLVLIRLE